MKIAMLALLFITQSTVHSGRALFNADQTFPYPIIFVHNCAHEYVPIYVDKELTVKLPNPFLGERDGSFAYFTSVHRTETAITKGNESVIISDCPPVERIMR